MFSGALSTLSGLNCFLACQDMPPIVESDDGRCQLETADGTPLVLCDFDYPMPPTLGLGDRYCWSCELVSRGNYCPQCGVDLR